MNNKKIDLDQAMKKAAKLTHRPQKKFAQQMEELDAKKLVWSLCQQILNGEDEHRKFEVDEYNKRQLRNMTLYFTGNPDCDWDLNKGLYLVGYVGVGKTMLMTIFKMFCDLAEIEQRKFRIKPTSNIYEELMKTKNPNILKKYYHGDICFDDLGTEQTLYQDYGNVIPLMATILTNRATNFVKGKCLTHVTSNIPITKHIPKNGQPQIQNVEQRYGTRVYDRCRQMFNEVVFYNPTSRRR